MTSCLILDSYLLWSNELSIPRESKQTLPSVAQTCWLCWKKHFNLNLWIDLVKLTLPKPSEQYITIEITFPSTAYRGSTSRPNIHIISVPERHLPNWEPVVSSADISSVTTSQTDMSLALDVSLSSLTSIVDVSIASLRRQVLKCLCSFNEGRCSHCESAYTCTCTFICGIWQSGV